MAGEGDVIAALQAAQDAGPPEDRPVAAIDRECAGLLRNDIGNADRLIARHGADLAYHPALGWHVWTGAHWDGETGDLEAQKKAQATARAIYVEARAFPPPDEARLRAQAVERGLADDALEAWVEKKMKGHQALVDAHLRFAKSSGNSGKISAMLAEAAPHRVRRPEAFDALPFAFNARNKTIHLSPKGVSVRPHHRGDLLTKMGGCAFDGDATCPAFTAFLEAVQPDPVMRGFLQRLGGYLLTADMSEQAFVIFQGSGRNGKGTFMNALRSVLGQYAVTAKIETFGADSRKGGSDANPDVARMRAARAIMTSDAPENFTLHDGMVKQATGEEPMTARQLHRDFVEFEMTGKVIIPCNPKPRITGGDDGIWRRVMLTPWLVQIPEAEIDRTLGAKLKAEASGILNWMIEGYRMWAREGLNPPDGVRAATADYRAESDPMAEFLQVWTDKRPEAKTAGARLFEKFVEYAKANALPEPKSAVSFGKRLKARGFESYKSHGTKMWMGIALREEPRDDPKAEELRRRAYEATRRAALEAAASASPPAPAPHQESGDGEGDDPPHAGYFRERDDPLAWGDFHDDDDYGGYGDG